MASAELKDAINRNIRRNLGVFEVPGYLFQGDPVDKFGLDCRANVMGEALLWCDSSSFPEAPKMIHFEHDRMFRPSKSVTGIIMWPLTASSQRMARLPA